MNNRPAAPAADPSPWAIAERRPPSGWVVTKASLQRFVLTIAFAAYGTLSLMGAVFMGGSLVIVPLFSLENDLWNRPDNPATWPNVGWAVLVGAGCLFFARSNDRTRRRLGVAVAAVAFIWAGIYVLMNWR